MILSEYWKDNRPASHLLPEIGPYNSTYSFVWHPPGSKHQVTTKTLGRNAYFCYSVTLCRANVFNSPQQSISINTFIDHRTERNKSVDYIFAAVRTERISILCSVKVCAIKEGSTPPNKNTITQSLSLVIIRCYV